MIKIKEAIIVEGKYDKIKLSQIFDTTIIETNGFRIFKDKEKQNLIRQIAAKRGIVIMTDSDGAGLVIRNFLNGMVVQSEIKHCYIPQIKGKEKRKAEHSKEGFLGVEGIDEQTILKSLETCKVTVLNTSDKNKTAQITKSDLYELGLTGTDNSAKLRRLLLTEMDLPPYLSTNAFLNVVNCLYTLPALKEKLNHLIE